MENICYHNVRLDQKFWSMELNSSPLLPIQRYRYAFAKKLARFIDKVSWINNALLLYHRKQYPVILILTFFFFLHTYFLSASNLCAICSNMTWIMLKVWKWVSALISGMSREQKVCHCIASLEGKAYATSSSAHENVTKQIYFSFCTPLKMKVDW